jgi:hypothetical protein
MDKVQKPSNSEVGNRSARKAFPNYSKSSIIRIKWEEVVQIIDNPD